MSEEKITPDQIIGLFAQRSAPIGFATLLARLSQLERRVTMLEQGGRHREPRAAKDFAERVAEAEQEQAGRCVP